MQRGFAHIFALAGILVLVLVAAEVFYFSKVKPAKQLQKASESSIVSSPVPDKQESKSSGFLQIPSITTSTVAKQPEFNDYSNSGFGFAFNYDKNFSVKDDSEEEFNKRGNGDFRKNFKGYVGYEPAEVLGAAVVLDKNEEYDLNPFSVWVFDNPDDLTIDKWYGNYWYYPFVWGDFTQKGKIELAPMSDATVSGQIGKSGVIDYQPGKPKFVYLAQDKKMYLFRIIGTEGDSILT